MGSELKFTLWSQDDEHGHPPGHTTICCVFCERSANAWGLSLAFYSFLRGSFTPSLGALGMSPWTFSGSVSLIRLYAP